MRKFNQNLVTQKSQEESIHLCDFPVFEKECYDEELMKNIDSIISIVQEKILSEIGQILKIDNYCKLMIHILIPKQKNITLDDSETGILEELNIKDHLSL